MKQLLLSLTLIWLSTMSCFAQATNTFPSIGSVGIGTTNPESSYLLKVQASSFKRVLIVGNHNAPLIIKGSDLWSGIAFDDSTSGGPEHIWYNGVARTFSIGGGGANVSGKKLHIEGGTTIGADYKVNSVASNGLAVQGNVGIGTTDPTEKLEVNGTIRSKEVKVEATGWPDYVFGSGYNLMDIGELKKYLDQHGHLPGIPTAEEIKEQGQNLGEMQAMLLKKIEELTLYIIQQQQLIEKLAKEEN